MNLSTGLVNAVLDDGFDTVFANPVMLILTGAQPASADDAQTGSLICEVSLPASGYFAAASNGVKGLAGSWSGTVTSAGTAGYFRIKNGAGDTGAASTALPRIDGSIGDDGTFDLILQTVLAVGDTIDIDTLHIGVERTHFSTSGDATLI